MPRNFVLGAAHYRDRVGASMRPRQMPRNFTARPTASRTGKPRFNEAAADAAEFCYLPRKVGDSIRWLQ